jgi:hypothetical protein
MTPVMGAANSPTPRVADWRAKADAIASGILGAGEINLARSLNFSPGCAILANHDMCF